MVVDIEDRPGAFGEDSRRMAAAGVNIDLAYVAASGQLVLAVDDLDKARAAV